MTAVAPTGAAAFLARYEALRDTLPGDPAIRARAAEALRRHGLPTTRDEVWKYTSLRPLAALDGISVANDAAAVLPDTDGPCAVLVDGLFRPDLSRLPSGLRVATFSEVGFPARSLADPESEGLVALNAMLAEDGIVIDVAEGQDAGHLLLVTTTTGARLSVHPRHAFRLASGARLRVTEVASGAGAYLHNPVTEIALASGATLAHVRLQDESREAFHLATIYVDAADGATYDSFNLTLGGRLSRTEIHARLGGRGATTLLNAAQLLGGAQHGDFTTIVAHDAPACASRQTVKNVLAGHARGVFQGKIVVARGAQKTDGYQMNQALLLSPEAEIDTKPQLEIYADDVKCSHGATVGELDADQLFYLRSRGVAADEARAILVRAFLADALEAIGDPGIRARLDAAVERSWAALVS